MRLRYILLSLILVCSLITAYARVSVRALTIEHRTDPINLEVETPRVSWQITSDRKGVEQTAYRIMVATDERLLDAGTPDVWDSGTVQSAQSVLVPLTGMRMQPNSQYLWRVQADTNKGSTPWSQTAHWSTAQMGETSWQGRWIGWDAPFGWDVEDEHSQLSARYLRKEFDTQPKPIKRVIVHISGLGLYELYINGQRVGDRVLAPSPTDYRRTVLYNTYDVTDLIDRQSPANAIGVILGNGRYYTMQQGKKTYKIPTFGYPQMRLNMIIEYADGSRQRLNSDESWRLTAMGPIRSNNEYDGEIYDARLSLGDWTMPGYADSTWLNAQRVQIPYGTLRANIDPGMKVMRTIKPQSLRKCGDRWIVDFGQNTAGWVRIDNISGISAGDTLRIRYSELLTSDGLQLDTENLRHARSTDTYIASGHENRESWHPVFSYHGFRYAEITGIDNLSADDITAEVIYDEMADNGTFECSQPTINALHRIAREGVTSNYKGMPIDCPQRDERQPWTGDHCMGAWGENYMLDNTLLYTKWMRDIREAQREDGVIPDVCPAFWNYYTPDLTWSSTLLIASDMLYRQSGDISQLEAGYDNISRWLTLMRDRYSDKRQLIRADKYGDWCVPPEDPKLIHTQDHARKTDGTLIASAYYYKAATMMAEIARLTGHDADAEHWRTEADEMRTRFNQHFLTCKRGTSPRPGHMLYPDSVYYGNNTVTANIVPLAFGMVPDSCFEAVRDNVIRTIITDNNGHVSCGVIGMNWLMRQLTRMGRGDVAMLLASQRTYPSFGYMIDHGATTVWELWNGDTASRKMNSCNHVMMLGDIISWMYGDLAGINPAKPGYKEIDLRPDFSIPDLFDACASYESPYGTIVSDWHRHHGHLDWHISVPCNTTAILNLPTSDPEALSGVDAEYLSSADGISRWRIESGEYNLSIDIDPAWRTGDSRVVADEFIYESASFPECHASTICEMGNGDLVTAFFGGTKERNPDCCIWVARKPKGASCWTEPMIAADGVFDLADPYISMAGLTGINDSTTLATAGPHVASFVSDIDNARRKACWNPVLYRIPGTDRLLLYYKIGTNVGDWTGWVSHSDDGGMTWSEREPLPDGILGPIKNKPEYIDGRLICPSSRERGGWRAWIEYSDDQGRTWHATGALPSDSAFLTADPTNLQPIYAIQPSILRLADGRLKILCRTRNGHLATSYSSDNGSTWTPVTLTDMPNNSSGTDAVTLADGRHLLIYNNFETLQGTPRGARTPLTLAISDDGQHWRDIITLEDSPVSQYSYPAIIQSSDGLVHIVYTWRRQRIRHIALDPKGF